MKKSPIVFTLSVLALAPMVLLTMSIKENKAEQQAIGAVPVIKENETRASEWGKHYPRQYDTYMQTRKSDEIADVLKQDPALVVMWAGYAFSKDYNKPRGHYYALEDNINTLRTGAPVDGKTGPLPTACWTCKSPDVPRLIKRDGEMEFFTGKWAKYGDEIVNPIGCGDCHDSSTMKLTLTRDYLKRGLEAEGRLKTADVTHQDMRSLVCAQCHAEYYFKKTEWDDKGEKKTAMVVTFPWKNGLSAENMEAYYDDYNFSDWTHQMSKTPMLKAQHPDYETFVTGVHYRNGLSCADCHMPYVREGGVKYSNHKIGSPLDNIANTCLNCHKGTEKEFRETVEKKLARKNELAKMATDVLAQAHLEAAKAWELGATEEEMKLALQDIRHGQWRWDYAVAGHGAFFHAPEETLRVLAGAINKGQDARLKLRIVLAKYNAADYVGPDFSTKEKAQAIIGLPFEKLIEEKKTFLNTLRQEWIKQSEAKGLYDPATRKDMVLKTSYN
ncbi:ammonia-forming cytochrome c nitrite reductase [Desulfobulbus sp.]|uniref:ammonia-forming cytochrome c nitrite reductase n=1 Tax=Desulfobulbus sp. TaxID=895 RepID=UPI0027BAC629|nr:ammonia-forming cytochrome c nitrite reductase [Desulfobulbus sp.]